MEIDDIQKWFEQSLVSLRSVVGTFLANSAKAVTNFFITPPPTEMKQDQPATEKPIAPSQTSQTAKPVDEKTTPPSPA